MRKVHTAPTTGAPERIERWQAPTGRYLEKGQAFQVKDRGWFIFIAYVEADKPYVEAKKKGSPNVRCIRPETITRTSRKQVAR